MTTQSRIAYVTGAVVIAIATLGGLVFAANTLFDRTKTEHFTIAQTVGTVIVTADGGDISVVAADTPRVTVRETMHWLIHEPSPETSVSDGVLRLEDTCGHRCFAVRCETDYRIEVPRGVAVELHADAGDVQVSGVNGALVLETDAGDIQGTALGAAEVRASADAGDVELAFATAPMSVDARTSAGDVDIELPAAEYAVDADADAGDASVRGIVRYDRSAHKVSAHADAGDVTIREQ
jgi:hypothetical protein